ncbi:type 4a pilus biogenesis protein PilO, partial [Candidatus Marinimicrobia bacterium]|nr:type 4a pilus biogenesis protein PilO [Candidatus Neomarinimicrobiota bacterium]
MRTLIEKYFSNAKSQFIASSLFLFIFLSFWYILFYKDISDEYKKSISLEENVSRELNRFKSMQLKLGDMENHWSEINSKFQIIIERIPDKRLLENVTDHLYSDLIQNNLKIINFSPSNIAINKESISLPDMDGEIIVEKIPIDITLRGSFLNFNKFLENLKNNRYRFTTSNVGVSQEKSSPEQTIELIAYAYFQSSKNVRSKKPLKIKKNDISSSTKSEKISQTKPNAEQPVKNVAKKDKIIINEDLKDVPEMWLEPATEPI